MKRFIFSIILLTSLISVQGQVEYDLNVTAPSPNAAALGEYADVPVSLYTGTPNISIPIHTFQGKHLSVPISLSYHASGIKVDEIASNVGLGWALNAGGVITRTVYGLPDEIGAGFQNQPSDLGSQSNLLEAAARGQIDAQPDMFFFNFQGTSGKFIITNGGEIMVAPYQDMKIETGNLFESWTITTTDGIKYTFGGTGAIEITTSNSVNCASEQNPAKEEITSWYLKTIEHPNGEIITFSYLSTNLQYISSVSQSQSFPMYGETCSGCYSNTILQTCAQEALVDSKYLSMISGSTGSVEFKYSGRDDLPGGVKLDLIAIKGTVGSTYREVGLYYDYFSAAGRSAVENISDLKTEDGQFRKRLQLTSVSTGGNIPPYQFEYNEEGTYQLPPRFSYQQDHWGYANANSKITLIPINNNFHQFQDGADRAADPERTKAGSLKKVIYPTGGDATFEFEAHDFGFRSRAGAESVPVRNPQDVSMTANWQEVMPKQLTFNIEVSQMVTVNTLLLVGDPINDLFLGTVEIRNSDGLVLFSTQQKGTSSEEVFLVPGDYEVFIDNLATNESVDVDLGWEYVLSGTPSPEFHSINTLIVEPRSLEVEIGLDDPETVQVIPFAVSTSQFIDVTSKLWAQGLNGDVVGLAEIRNANTGALIISASIGEQATTGSVYFPAGDYEIQINIKDWECASFYLEWDEYVEIEPDEDGVYKNLAGGLRIKKVELNDGTKNIVNNYSYLSEDQSDRSSGIILNQPRYFSNRLMGITGVPGCAPGPDLLYICNKIQGSSSSVVHLGSTQGSHVGYANVSVTKGSGQAGRTVSWFSFASDEGSTGFPFGPITSQDWQRGLLKRAVDYDSDGNPVREVNNDYDFIEQGRVTGYRTALVIANLQDSPAEVVYQTYDVISGWVKLNSTTETLDGVTKTTNYTYGSANVLTNLRSSEFTNSDGRTYRTEYDYATDVSNQGMIDKYMLSIPVETRELVNSQQVGGVQTLYEAGGIAGGGTHAHLIVPKDLFRWEGKSWDKIGTFTEYSADGFPKKFIKEHYEDYPLTYSWSNGLLTQKRYSNFIWDYFYAESTHRLLEKAVYPDKRATEYTYDGIQRLKTLKEIGTDGSTKSTTTLGYYYGNPAADGNSINTTITYGSGPPPKESNKYFDGLGRPYKTEMKDYVNGQNVITEQIIYADGINRVAKKTHLVGNFETYTYASDPLDRVLVTLLPDGNTIEMEYGNDGNYYEQIIKDEKGNETITKTDILGRTVNVQDAKQGNTAYQYDNWGNVDNITTPLGNQYIYSYDYSQNHLASKTIPGGGTITFDYYDDKDLLMTQTDQNGNELTYEYDEHDRMIFTRMGSQVLIENVYYTADHVDKIERSIYAILDNSGTTTDHYLYDAHGRVEEHNYHHPLGIDKTTNTYDDADRLEKLVLDHNGYQGLDITNQYTYDNWDRSLIATHEIAGLNRVEEIRNNLLYDERDQLRVKSIGGGLQNFSYTYESARGWLQQINDPLGLGQTLAGCEIDKPKDPKEPPTESKSQTPDTVDINLLLQLRETLVLQIQDALDSLTCPIVPCDPPTCSAAEATEQQLCILEAIEDTKNQTGSTQSIPCEDGTTEEVWVPNVSSFPIPADVIRVRLCDGTERYLLRSSAKKICGPYEELQSITIISVGQVFEVENEIELSLLNLEELLGLIVNGEAPLINGYEGCGHRDCTLDPPNCDDVIVQIQQTAIDILKPKVPEITAEDLPVTIYEMATCTGDLFYVLEEEYPVVEHTQMEVVDTITIDSMGQDIPIDIVTPLEGECEDLFYLLLDYEENGNIKSKNWQVYGRQEMQYKYNYDELNRLERAVFSEVAGRDNTTGGNRYGIPSITYDADGNIETLSRNGVTGICSNGLPEFGPIDVLQYTYNHSSSPNRLLSVTDGTGNEKGFNPGAGPGTYGYDGNGNLTDDPYKGLTITYNYLNLPELIQKGGDQIRILYDAAGRKLQQEFIPAQGEGVLLDYISGVEYRDAEVNSVFHEEGRAFNDEGDWRYEYFIKDHLGNTRLVVADLNGDGCINPLSDPSEILQENHYYPFGLNMDGPWAAQYQLEETDQNGNGILDPVLDEEGNPIVDQTQLNRYQYNGKELTTDLGLNWNDYGARWYDPAIARWNAVDPLAEKYYSFTPYHYTANNPIRFIDYDGRDYGVNVDHDKKTITIRAHFFATGADMDAVNQSIEFWNEQSGNFEYVVGKGDEATSYQINFDLTVTEVKPGGEFSTDLDNSLLNFIIVAPDNAPMFKERREMLKSGKEKFTKPQGGSDGRNLSVKESQKSNVRFLSHEEGHNLGMNHTGSGRMNTTGSGKKINRKNVTEALGYGGVGQGRKGYKTKAKVKRTSTGKAIPGFDQGRVKKRKSK